MWGAAQGWKKNPSNFRIPGEQAIRELKFLDFETQKFHTVFKPLETYSVFMWNSFKIRL